MHLNLRKARHEVKFHTLKLTKFALFFIIVTTVTTYAENNNDLRIFVKLPDEIKEDTVIIMRDHIHALEDIIHSIQSEDYKEAERIVDSRLSWGSGGHIIIKHWPEPMQHMANHLYRTASNYVVTSQNAAKIDSRNNEEDVIAALGNVITACRSCHEKYRIR
ncbi:MAG: hypothetical protein AB8B92_02475 [Gammaproteobacteria bacterium]